MNRFLLEKNARTHATNTTNGVINTDNGIAKAKSKSACTSGPGGRPIIVRLVIKQIIFVG